MPQFEPEIFETAKTHLKRFRKVTYLIELEQGESPRTASKMLGAAYLLPHESWPRCPFCNYKMTLLLQVAVADIADVAPALDRRGLLQFFCCLNTREMPGTGKPECNGTSGWHIKDRNNLARVVVPDGESNADGPPDHATKDDYELDLNPRHTGGAGSTIARRIRELVRTEEYPHRYEAYVHPIHPDPIGVELRAARLAPKALDAFLGHSGAARRPKIAGWPTWLQAPQRPRCPTCDKTMTMIISLSPYEAFHIWHDAYVNVFYCATHPQNFATEFQNT